MEVFLDDRDTIRAKTMQRKLDRLHKLPCDIGLFAAQETLDLGDDLLMQPQITTVPARQS